MTGDSKTDLDAALDRLAEKSPPDDAPPPPAATPPPVPSRAVGPTEAPSQSAGNASPPVPAVHGAGASKRVPFDDLFATESAPAEAMRGSFEEKIDYFRKKLKQAEALIARVRKAWEVRERELDDLESVVEAERHRAEEAIGRRQALEKFISDKKSELVAFQEKVSQAFATQEQSEERLRTALQTAEAELAKARHEFRENQEGMAHELEVRDEAIDRLKGIIEAQSKKLAKKDEEVELELGSLRSTVTAREQSIKKLKAAYTAQKDAVANRDAQIAGLSARIADLEAEILRKAEETSDGRQPLSPEIVAMIKRVRKVMMACQQLLDRLERDNPALLEQPQTSGHFANLRKVLAVGLEVTVLPG